MKRRLFSIMFAALLSITSIAGGTQDALAAENITSPDTPISLYDPSSGEYLVATETHHNEDEAVYADEAWSDAMRFTAFSRSGGVEVRYETGSGNWAEGSFTEAIANVCEGGTIELLQDVYLTQTATLNHPMTITSADSNDPKIITCAIGGHGYLIQVKSEVVMSNIVVDGGYDADSETKIYGTRALIAVNGGSLELQSGSEIRNNYNATVSGAGGGLCLIDGSVTMNGGSIHDNYACSGGGAAIVQESSNLFTFTDGSIENNTSVAMYTNRTYTSGWRYQIRAGGFGGGIAISAGKLVVNGGSIRNNIAQPIDLYKTHPQEAPNTAVWYSCEGGYGGGIAMYSSSPSEPVVEIANGSLEGNTAFMGGALYVDWGSASIQGSSLMQNKAVSKVMRDPNETGGYTERRLGGYGGAVYLSCGNLNIAQSSIAENAADYYGGGVYQLQSGLNSSTNKLMYSSNLVLDQVILTQNQAYACAGMFIDGSDKSKWNNTDGDWGTTRLKDTHISGNAATSKSGGILVAPWLDVMVSGNVRVENNTAPDHHNFLLDNDIETNFNPGRIVVEGALADTAIIYADVCEHTTPYREVKQLIATGTSGYTITASDFAKFESDNELYITLHDTNNNIYLVPTNPKVTFDSMGGSVITPNPVEVPYSTAIEEPAAPYKTGYTFAGWHISADDGLTLSENAYDFSLPVTEDFVLYAKWEALPKLTKAIVFKVVNGTWADGTIEDKILNIPLTYTSENTAETAEGTLNPRDIPDGMKPNEGYDQTGYWDAVPPTTVQGTETAVFTYIFAEKLPVMDLPKTGDTSRIGLYFALCALSIAGMGVLVYARSKYLGKRK